MSTQLLDDKKNPFPTYAKVPGGTVVLTVTSSVAVEFEPDPALSRVVQYEIRTTSDIRVSAHDDTHVFDSPNEPVMWAGEIDVVELGPIGTHPRTKLTMLAVSADATVTIAALV